MENIAPAADDEILEALPPRQQVLARADGHAHALAKLRPSNFLLQPSLVTPISRWLFRPKRAHRIDACSPPGRNKTGYERNEAEYTGAGGKSKAISRADSEQ